MSFPKFVYMTKNTPLFPILHVFAPLNDVRAYIAWSWKTTLITWIFGRAWYPLDIRVPPPPTVVICIGLYMHICRPNGRRQTDDKFHTCIVESNFHRIFYMLQWAIPDNIHPPPIEGTGIPDHFLLLTTWNSRLFYSWSPGISALAGIPDFFTHEHLEGFGIPDFFVGIVLGFHDFFFFFFFFFL